MSNRNASVTVLMTVYNPGIYLDSTIESIQRQTHTDFEFLIVDDGSTDGSSEALEKFAVQDSRIRVVHANHRGIAATRNHGLGLAAGEIVVCMDHDDLAMPERIARQLAFLAEHPAVVAVGSAMRMVDQKGRAIGQSCYPSGDEEIRNWLLRGNCPLAHPTVALRRKLVLAMGGYRTLYDASDDFDLWLRLSERHELANMPDVLLDYRWHGANTTARRRREQALAGHIARLVAGERQRGRPDPTNELTKLSLADLDRFKLSDAERAAILTDLSEAGLVSYEATGHVRYLADVEETLFDPGHPRSPQATKIAKRLARHLWNTGERRRSIAAASWKLRRQLSRLNQPKAWVRARPGHRMITEWLIYCADPLPASRPTPRRELARRQSELLLALADRHGVLPAVLRHFPPLHTDPGLTAHKVEAQQRHRDALAFSLMLRTHGEAVLSSAARLPVLMVKGPVFARTIYPAPSLRTFTDIDLLVAPEAESQLAQVLAAHGFQLAKYERDPERLEWKWLNRDNEALMIEVHTNLVHHPALRAAISIQFQDLVGIAETPAALLTVAVVHGALDRFERLRQVVDVCQAARRLTGAEEEQRFETLLQRTGARLAAAVGLDLAYRLFGEPRCRDLARGLGQVRHASLARLLIGRSAVISSMTEARFYHSWRRQGLRGLLKRSQAC